MQRGDIVRYQHPPGASERRRGLMGVVEKVYSDGYEKATVKLLFSPDPLSGKTIVDFMSKVWEVVGHMELSDETR